MRTSTTVARSSQLRRFFWGSRVMRTILSLQGHHDFVRRNSALTQNLPAALAESQIDDRRGLGACRRAAVDDERNALANLVADAARAGALRGALQIGRSGRDGQTETLHHRASNRCIGYAQ